jgi:hypothetical protein
MDHLYAVAPPIPSGDAWMGMGRLQNTSDPYFRDKANAIKKSVPPTLVGIRDKARIKRKRRLNVKQTL